MNKSTYNSFEMQVCLFAVNVTANLSTAFDPKIRPSGSNASLNRPSSSALFPFELSFSYTTGQSESSGCPESAYGTYLPFLTPLSSTFASGS